MTVEEWFSKQSKWLNTGANWLIRKQELSQEDINNLVNLCLKEVGIELKVETPDFEDFQSRSLSDLTTDALLFHAISNPLGVNALVSETPLEFCSEQLNIIYGENGSGKSGYTRILKHATGSKWKESILGNVYSEAYTGVPRANISYSVNSHRVDESWAHPYPIDALAPVKIFDTQISNFYLSNKNEASFEPFILVFFKRLGDLVKKVEAVITDYEQKKGSSVLPNIPTIFFNTLLVKNVFALKSNSDISHHLSLVEWTSIDETRVKELSELLNTKDIDAKKKSLNTQIKHLNTINLTVSNIVNGLSDEKLKAVVTARRNSKIAAQVAQQYATSIFENAQLDGVGQQTWQAMWNSAKKYSSEIAYIGKEYPNVDNDALCVLCHQVLDNESKVRIESFEQFVTSDLQEQANKAAKTLNQLEQALPNIPENIALNIASQGFDEQECVEVVASWLNFKETALSSVNIEDIPQYNIGKAIPASIVEKVSSLLGQLTNLDQLVDQEQKKKLETELIELKAKQWSYSFKDQIKQEHKRLSNLQKLNVAKKTAASGAITTFKNKLAKEYLTARYINDFNHELKSLGGGRIKVNISQEPGGKGSTFYKLLLKGSNHPANKVLSEGEAKLVTLAAFLADAQLNIASTPFIFDDPITSLDIRYEENVVKRLVELAKNRQVIIFTHRISFLSLLNDEAKRSGLSPHTVHLMTTNKGAGKLSSKLPFNADDPVNVINRLRNEMLPAARKSWDANEIDSYNIQAKGICSQFRIELEKIVEKIVLADIVKRYRRSVTTQNRIHNIAKITSEDCSMIDKYMTIYSCYEHSQADEIATVIPEPDVLKAHLSTIIDWVVDLKERTK